MLLNVKEHFSLFHSKDIRAMCCATQAVPLHTEGQASMALFILFSLWYVFPPHGSAVSLDIISGALICCFG